MNLLNIIIDTWSRFFVAIYDFALDIISSPIDTLLSFGIFLGEVLLLLIVIISIVAISSGLYGAGVSIIGKLGSHPSQYTDYKNGDTRKCLLLVLMGAASFYVAYLINVSTTDVSEAVNLEGAFSNLNAGIAAMCDVLVIICTLAPFIAAYVVVQKVYAKHDAAVRSTGNL